MAQPGHNVFSQVWRSRSFAQHSLRNFFVYRRLSSNGVTVKSTMKNVLNKIIKTYTFLTILNYINTAALGFKAHF